jgi:hypothetical protein
MNADMATPAVMQYFRVLSPPGETGQSDTFRQKETRNTKGESAEKVLAGQSATVQILGQKRRLKKETGQRK